MATLTVGSGKQFTTIAAAVAAAKAGDTVAVQAGTYVNDDATIKTAITLVAVGGPVTMLSTSTAAPAAALLTVAADATVNGFTFSGMRTSSGTGAGILVQSGNLTVQNSLFLNNQNGLLASANATATVTIQASEFSHNGNNDGFSGNVSVGAIKALTITGSYIHDTQGGDEIRSLAATTSITGTCIQDNSATALYAVEAANGGVVTLSNDTIEKGAASTAAAAIHFGGGTVQAGSSLAIQNDTLVSDKAGASILLNQAAAIASISANSVYGFASTATGPAATFGDTVAASRPTVSTTALVTGGLVAPVAYGRAGAVVASGHVLTVGAGQTYTTLPAAVAAAVDGDTIKVQAGLYVNDSAVISHKVIIEGVGGQARFVDTMAPTNGLAQFVTTTDVTFQNIEIFGATAVGGVAAAILDQGGNLTIDNSDIHDNQAGVVATASAGAVSGSVGIYDSEIIANGTADGRGANVSVGVIGTLTLQNDLVADAVTGPEVTSDANNTTLSAVRIVQAAGNAAPDVALPDGGLVTITASAIEKAASATPAPLVQVGGGIVAAGSAVSLTNDTLITDETATAATFVANTAPAVSVSATGTMLVGGTASNIVVSGGTSSGSSVKTALAVNLAAPDSPAGAPAAAPLTIAATTDAAQPGQLDLFVSEAAFHGDAQFTVTVDGTAVGGTLTATASHAARQTEQFAIAGNVAPGPHTVAVAFTNSLGAGTAGRALYVDGLTFNGQNDAQSATLTANGSALLETGPVSTPEQVTVHLSAATMQGNAQAFISIDGKVQGGVQTITASHAAGASQAISFLVNLTPGAHTIETTLLNGLTGAAGSRTLFVDSIDVASAHYAAAATTIGASGTAAFAFTAAPPASANGALFITSSLPQPLSAVLPA